MHNSRNGAMTTHTGLGDLFSVTELRSLHLTSLITVNLSKVKVTSFFYFLAIKLSEFLE